MLKSTSYNYHESIGDVHCDWWMYLNTLEFDSVSMTRGIFRRLSGLGH